MYTEPRYDEIFLEGVEWLDELAFPCNDADVPRDERALEQGATTGGLGFLPQAAIVVVCEYRNEKTNKACSRNAKFVITHKGTFPTCDLRLRVCREHLEQGIKQLDYDLVEQL